MKANWNYRGFSLIEVMVALLVLALGILAISKLQGVLIQSASDSNHRAVAVSLAQQKIDDLRSFSNSAGFQAIDTNVGGEIQATDSAFTIARENYRYSLGWDVVNYFHLPNAPLGPAVAGEPGVDDVPLGATPDLKVVNVFVAWQDEAGDSHQVTLETIIDSYPPALTSASGEPSAGGPPIRASYTPELAPDVIDINVDTGDGKLRQTSKPLPEVVKTGQNDNTIVSFEVVTYEPDPRITGGYVADRQEEFVTVDCNCRLSGTDGLAMTPAHVVWDAGTEGRFDARGQWTTKQTAVEVNNSNAAAALCFVCCRDHHDDDVSPVKYVPGTSSGNHDHYKVDGLVAQAGDVYVESCRLKRVDGIMRVFQNWKLHDISILDRFQLFDGQQLQTDYQNYVGSLVLFEVTGEGTAIKPISRTAVAMNQGGGQQLQSRGIYIDRVYDMEGTYNPGSYLDYVADPDNEDRLEKVPFSEVNLTLLSDWISAEPSFVNVSNEPVATIADPENNYYGTYSRGWIEALAITAGVNITTTMRTNNDGFTQVTTTPNIPTVQDSISVAVGEPGPEVTISGTYEILFPLGRTGTPTIDIAGSGDCNLPAGNTYVCVVNTPWTGSIQIEVAVTSGPEASRCSGASEPFVGNSLNAGLTYNFAAFECTK